MRNKYLAYENLKLERVGDRELEIVILLLGFLGLQILMVLLEFMVNHLEEVGVFHCFPLDYLFIA